MPESNSELKRSLNKCLGGRRAAACPHGRPPVLRELNPAICMRKAVTGGLPAGYRRATGGRPQCVSASATLYEKHHNFCLRTPIGPIFGGMKLDFHIYLLALEWPRLDVGAERYWHLNSVQCSTTRVSSLPSILFMLTLDLTSLHLQLSSPSLRAAPDQSSICK